MKKILVLAIVFMLQISSYCINKVENEILFISSYNASFPTYFNQLNGIMDGLKNDYVLDLEVMDSKRFFDQEYLDMFYEAFKYKYENHRKPNAIIVADDNAYNFVLENHDSLFQDIPVVFIGVNTIENALRADKIPSITGFVEEMSLKDTIDVASDLLPQAKHLVVIVDDTTTGKGQLKNFNDNKSLYEDEMEIQYILLKNLDFDEYQEKLRSLNSQDIVLLFSAVMDRNGDRINFNDVMNMINDNVNVPVFHLWRYGVGEGLAGGKLVSHYQYGFEAASLVRDILNGKVKIEDIKVKTQSDNSYIFDNNILEKHNLNPAVLPANTVFLNKVEPYDDFFEKYQGIIIPYLLVMFTMFFLIIFLLSNISERKEKEKEIKKLAFFDKLTDLPNRVALMQELKSEYISNGIGAILAFDIDNFKNINDVYGHSLGDKVLVELSKILQANLGEGNFLAKTAADEYIILLKGLRDKQEIREYIKELLCKVSDKIEVEGYSFYITFSIGIAIYPYDGNNSEELFMNADVALYKAKENGKNKSVFFVNSFNKGLKDKLDIQTELINALNNNEFYLCYQPKYLLDSNDVINYEALLRWESPKLGSVSPELFIEVAEEMGIIHDIGKFVLEESCGFIEYMALYGHEVGVSVNVSTHELNRENFVEEVFKTLKKYSINPKQIGLEITETVLITNFRMVKELLEQLSSHGIKILLDDFGKGYSSLNYIRNLPIDSLKIDKTFIDRITQSQEDRVMVKSIIEIAHVNGMIVIAEGVEQEQQLDILKTLGCDAIQGYLIAKPMRKDYVLEAISKVINCRKELTG